MSSFASSIKRTNIPSFTSPIKRNNVTKPDSLMETYPETTGGAAVRHNVTNDDMDDWKTVEDFTESRVI